MLILFAILLPNVNTWMSLSHEVQELILLRKQNLAHEPFSESVLDFKHQ